MHFLVSEIRNAGRVHQAQAIDPALLLGKPPEYVYFRTPLKIEATADMAQGDVVVSGQAGLVIGFSCARCLESFERPTKANFQQVFSADEKEIDISADIKEAIYIDLPLTPVCRESCKGLCPVCGVNKNEVVCQCQPAPKRSAWDALLNQVKFHDT